MAAFRYRVTAASGLIGGFRDKEDAEAFAKMKSESKGASFMAVFDQPHNKPPTQISGYMRGQRHDLFPPVTS